MFEHFGFLDAIAGLWRQKIKILVATVLCAVLGVCFASVMNYSLEVSEDKYLSSATYFVEFQEEDKENREEKNAATTLNTVLGADFCMKFITDDVIDNYGEENIKKALAMADDEEISYETIPALVKHSVLVDGNSVNIYLNASSQEFANAVINAYDSYVSHFATEMGNIRVVHLGGVQQGYVYEQEGYNKIKLGIIGAAGGFVLSCIIVFFWVLFCPVINRKSDFEEYGLRVFGKM
ncbi:hypothetical protein ACTNA4_05350 [Bariatricus sp. HCP28S3_A7]|uniref:hypothetical protein n=1 Tax=Bariatricus sp. HCP28S3_A7 TaxID=3438894 RepID=UPI003F89F19F